MDREAVFVATKGGFVPFDRDRLKDAFVRLEEHVAAGDLRRYGVAT
jgi:aryl-alcohol dehydrogenase-like predicted oxidoreductase